MRTILVCIGTIIVLLLIGIIREKIKDIIK